MGWSGASRLLWMKCGGSTVMDMELDTTHGMNRHGYSTAQLYSEILSLQTQRTLVSYDSLL